MAKDTFESDKLLEMRASHPDWIHARGDTHVILGVPNSIEAFKTPVEPGNSFSPGPGTYGVSAWVRTRGKLHAPEKMPLSELEWSFRGERVPALRSSWVADGIQVVSTLFTDGDVERSDLWDHLSVEIQNPTSDERELSVYLVLRSFGAAGGPVRSLALRDRTVLVNGAPLVFADREPNAFGAVSYEDARTDISVLLERGELPASREVSDPSGWASGALEYTARLGPGERARYGFSFHLHAGHWMLKDLSSAAGPVDIDGRLAELEADWASRIPIRLDLPDPRFARAFFAQLMHLSMFTVADQPRITPVSYPIWWLRDGAYVVQALDKGGLSQWAGCACRGMAARDAFGGFGAEGDGPGEGIWILSEHYLLTADRSYLEEIYPHVVRKAELIARMRRAEGPIKQFAEYVIPKCMLEPNLDVLCVTAKNGLIQGRMDHHFPLFWVNGFAYLGLRRAALCARALGRDGSAFDREADMLREALVRYAAEAFGKNDRDVTSALWPTGWADKDDPVVRERFEAFWNRVRCPGGRFTPETSWTYFEAGQAHNRLLLGERDRAWKSIEHFLANHTAPGLFTYPEATDGNTSMLWKRTRGWDDIEYVTPHGWTAAELFLLLRDCLAREDGDKLVIGSGIPSAWLDHDFEARELPTHFGRTTLRYEKASRTLHVSTERRPPGGILCELPGDVRVVT
jgi:hypothetical protein